MTEDGVDEPLRPGETILCESHVSVHDGVCGFVSVKQFIEPHLEKDVYVVFYFGLCERVYYIVQSDALFQHSVHERGYLSVRSIGRVVQRAIQLYRGIRTAEKDVF